MKVVIVAKTRRGSGACVGGITESGRSVRLVPADAEHNPRWGLEYAVGDVWKIEASEDPHATAPHVENILVHQGTRLRCAHRLEEIIERFMPPVCGGPGLLFEGLVQATSAGGLYVSKAGGLPRFSTMFWRPDRPLMLDCESKRLRYRCATSEGARTATFVGFQEPVSELPAGTLVRVSLAHPWRPKEHPDHELRCFVQLSGWYASDSGAILPAKCPLAHADAPTGRTIIATPTLDQALAVLKSAFGFSDFISVQPQVIQRALRREDSLVVMPTGGGKSLCYQLPALLLPGLTVVVSPLVALMQDQVRLLTELSIPAACLNHMVPLLEWTATANAARTGSVRLLYLAPETLFRPETLHLLTQSNLACLAVDEAHCISEWGHDFRPEYRRLPELRRRFPAAVCIALTATATWRVREDIRRLLQIPNTGEFIASFDRSNLFLQIEPRRDALAQILRFLQRRRGESGIIYCGTRKQVDELCSRLAIHGWDALPYHAGLDDDQRRRNQEQFIHDQVRLIVATIAFGMGINKANVRFVIHAHLPKDLESYYQEIGRAGRDGHPAHCLLLYSRRDAMVHRHFIDRGALSERRGRLERLDAILRFADSRACRRVPLLAYFGEQFRPPCGCCDRCVPHPEPAPSGDFSRHARMFLACVRETGQLFGSAHIIAVLRGSESERVLARGHHQLASWGRGRHLSTGAWSQLLDTFLQMDLLERDPRFGSLRLTAQGRQTLAGSQGVQTGQRHSSGRDAQ